MFSGTGPAWSDPAPRGDGRRARAGPAGRHTLAAVGAASLIVVLAALALPAGASAPRPSWSASNVLAISQNHNITMQSALSVSIDLANTSNIRIVFFTFCELTNGHCFNPVLMAHQGSSGWYNGTTQTMSKYFGIAPGIAAGYNITVNFTDNSTEFTEPRLPNAFPNLVVNTTTGTPEFEVVIINHAYSLGGSVTDSVSGQPIAGASVSLSPGTNRSVTSAGGAYAFPGLFNGTYTLSVSAAGYRTSTASVTVNGRDSVQDVALTNSSVSVPPSKSSGSPNPLVQLFHTPTGYAILAVLLAAIVAAVVWVARRGRRDRSSTQREPDPAAESRPPGSG